MQGEPRRVLIVRIGAMGDILHTMPAVAALRERHPAWEIGWVVESRWLPLLEAAELASGRPLVDRTILAATREWKRRPVSMETIKAIATLRGEMLAEGFDLCVDMQGSIRSAVIGRMSRAGNLVGPEDPKERPARWLYGKRIESRMPHVIEQGCELLGGAVGEKLQPAQVRFAVSEQAARACDAVLSKSLADAKDGFALLAPTAGWGAKQWPAERFGAVAAELGRRGIRSIVNASREGDVVAQKVVGTSEGYATAVAGNLPQLIELTRRASVVIAGDTGPLHLAAALERSVVALFGPTDPARNGPYGTQARVLRHGGERRDHRRLNEPEAGLLAITVEEVVEAAMGLLDGFDEMAL
ncbi:glycosyl transferase [Edaphobacter sp. 4G125]|nr:glycosyl transferase [Edaphobacter sp. 4G125]